MDDTKKILKAKLSRGSALSPGELSLVMRDVLQFVEEMEARIEAQDIKLDTLVKRGSRGSKGSNKTPEVRLDEEQ